MSTSAPRLLGGRYEVGELIGRGGMAEVHLGHDARLGRPVAIKILRTDHARDAAFLARFRREAQSVAGLNHRSIVAVYDSGEDRVEESGGASLSIPYIVMEYVDGRTLREMLNDTETGTLDPGEAAFIVQEVLEALDYSHNMGIVHRDIKPGNVMVSDDGSVKVMDFGIARLIADTQATMTQTQAVVGTAQYISPEQARGETVDKRSDVYSTGCLLFELLTGRTPYTGEPISLTYQHVNAEIPFASSVDPEIPAELDAIVLHALTKDRDERYPDAKSMAEDLAAFRSGLPISPVATSRLEGATTALPVSAPRAAADPGPRTDPDTASMPATTKRRGGGLGWLTAALLLIALVLLGWFAWGASQDDADEILVPSVIGLQEDEATTKIESLGLGVDVDTVASDDTKGQVIDQKPGAGSTLTTGEDVRLTVSGGPDEVRVPDVIGLDRDDATQTLENEGLEVGTVSEEDSSEQTKNRVISSSPSSSESVTKGTKIDLVVATGDVELKNYIGQDIEDVRADLYDLNLKVKTKPVGSSKAEGTILEQKPGAGKVKQGTTVTFNVAKAPTPPAETVTTTTSPSESSTSDDPTPTTTDEPEPTSTSSSGPLLPSPTSTSSSTPPTSTTAKPSSP